jgi:hypothetical protein
MASVGVSKRGAVNISKTARQTSTYRRPSFPYRRPLRRYFSHGPAPGRWWGPACAPASAAPPPRAAPCAPTATQQLRIATLRFGTARQKMALERRTNPKRQRRTWSPRYGGPSCRGKSAGVATRPRERSPTRNPSRHDSQLLHRCTHRGEPHAHRARVRPLAFAQQPLHAQPSASTPVSIVSKWGCLSTAGGTPAVGYPAARVV